MGGKAPYGRESEVRTRLEAEMRRGPLAHGFADDQRWALTDELSMPVHLHVETPDSRPTSRAYRLSDRLM